MYQQQPANQSVQVRIQSYYLPSVVNNLPTIRQISGCTVNAYESQDGVSDSVIELSGTSAQLQTAQALVQVCVSLK